LYQAVAADIKLVGKYVKDVLFEKTVFLWDRKALDTNGKLHKDYLENCRPLLANGKLVPLSKEEARPYMNFVWNLMVKDGCLQQLVVKQKVKLVPGSSEFIHE
jgi:hypothetical protein